MVFLFHSLSKMEQLGDEPQYLDTDVAFPTEGGRLADLQFV